MTIDLHWCATHLRSCDGKHWLSRGRQLHQVLIKSGFAVSVFASNCLLQMYARCSPGFPDARRLFDGMTYRNCFSWNSLIDSSISSGNPATSLQLFHAMPEKNEYSWNAIITGLVKLADIENALKLFHQMPQRHPIALNAVLHGLFHCGRSREAFRVYKGSNSAMAGCASPCLDSFVLATVISACADHKALRLGWQIHARIVTNQVDLDAALGSALVDMYGKCAYLNHALMVFDAMMEPDEYSLSSLITAFSKCGKHEDARKLFDRMADPGVVLWNSMIAGLASNGHVEDALRLFQSMSRRRINPDSSTFATILSLCSCLGTLKIVIQLHTSLLKYGNSDDIIVGSALIDSYSKAGSWHDAFQVFRKFRVHDTVLLNSMISAHSIHGRIEEARQLFDQVRRKSLISWNSMIVGYNQSGFASEALTLFAEMHRLGIRMDEVTLASVISASASLASLSIGEQVFAVAKKYGLQSHQITATSLVDLYCKCGCVTEGSHIFEAMRKVDEAPWNSMLMGYASNGMGAEVIGLFDSMRNAHVTPNEVTFIAVLSACCHCGLVEEGLSWFDCMKHEYGIDPVVEHYSCVVDLLVRAGRVEDAAHFIDCMPYDADVSMWTSVLGGCKASGDKLLGEMVTKKLIELGPDESGPYLQISSIYAVNGDWHGSQKCRHLIHEKKMRKFPGFSWINR